MASRPKFKDIKFNSRLYQDNNIKLEEMTEQGLISIPISSETSLNMYEGIQVIHQCVAGGMGSEVKIADVLLEHIC